LFEGTNVERTVDEANAMLDRLEKHDPVVLLVQLDRTLDSGSLPNVHEWQLHLLIGVGMPKSAAAEGSNERGS
jgi:hypothetical protein